MAYDNDLADRVREQLADEDGVTEKAMFGGLAFLLAGNMSVGLAGDELIVRVGHLPPVTPTRAFPTPLLGALAASGCRDRGAEADH